MRLLKKKKIKVYYICQYLQGYGKIAGVINQLNKSNNIDFKALVFPTDIQDIENTNEINKWKKLIGENVISAVTKDGWYDLKGQKPDYVFVQRPYDNYLPEEYSIENMKNFTKICYIPYGYSLLKIRDVGLPESFLLNLYYFFSDTPNEYEYAKGVYEKNNSTNYNHAINVGYPSLNDEIKRIENDYSAFNKIKKKKSLRIIWTPRWTTDKKLGETTFFDFKDDIINYFQKKDDMQLVFRPHPLMFENFISTNIMKKNEVNKYLSNFKDSNMVYDKSSNFFETFNASDVLITDISSIIVEYLVTGKPIILIETVNNRNLYGDRMKEIADVCYCVSNWKEIEKILDDLRKGKDSLKEKREELISNIKSENSGNVSKKIVSYLK